MSIKKNFLILASIIVAIPFLLAAFIYVQFYLQSTDRLLISGSKRIVDYNSQILSKKDNEEFLDIIKRFPLDVELCALTEENIIVFTSIPELELNKKITNRELWAFVQQTSKQFFYQYTRVELSERTLSIITRTSNKKHRPLKRKDFLPLITLVVFNIVIFCVILIILQSRTIFNSLKLIEESTQQIANGNLNFNINEQKKKFKENEITSILDSLDKMRISLLEEQNRKNKFIMGLSHDLRTPVAIIQGYIEAISDGVITEPDEIQKTMKLIQSKSSQLSGMIDTLINFMKMNNSEIRAHLTPSSISAIIKTFVKEAELTATVFKRKIETNIDLPEDIIVPLNEELARRSFENLFSNAIRYSRENDIIEINSYTKEHKLFFEIKDTGIGIAEKDLKYIFDIFYRVSNSRHEEGMGIGLSVVKNIIQTHNWNIDVQSELEKGTCFTITIPY